MIHISRMECQFHELTYMKASLELMDVKEEIDHLIRERHVLDQKIEAKNREQNELTEKCMRHITVLKRKGMMGDFYCPKKRGVVATPTKTGGSSYAPNYTPSLQMGTPPQAQMGNTSSQGGLWSPLILDSWPKLQRVVALLGLPPFTTQVDYCNITHLETNVNK